MIPTLELAFDIIALMCCLNSREHADVTQRIINAVNQSEKRVPWFYIGKSRSNAFRDLLH